jgi:hypothetical protein
MAYNKRTWTDRTVERPLTYILQDNGDGTHTLIPSEGSIIQTGTPITAANMNAIENGLSDASASVDDAHSRIDSNDSKIAIHESEINTLQTDTASLETLKAPKASPTFTGSVKLPNSTMIIGTGYGAGNYAYLNFMESNGATRKGYVGDAGSAESDMTLLSEVGDVRLQAVDHVFEVGNEGQIYLDAIPVVERGANGNGTWIKLYDGTLICWHRTTLTAQSVSGSYGVLYQGSINWTFPMAFASEPAVTCSEYKWGTSASWGSLSGTPTTTYAPLRIMDAFNRSPGTAYLSVIAIGRWK